MTRLLHDRYLAYDDRRGCDLVTGLDIRLDHLTDAPIGDNGSIDSGPAPPALVDVLNDVREGAPRWVVVDARTAAQVAGMTERAAAEARRRGLVPVAVSLYARRQDLLADVLRERTLLLIGGFDASAPDAQGALLRAAAACPRPHVLLTFRSASGAQGGWVAREARAAYSVSARSSVTHTQVRVSRALAADVTRLVERAERALELTRSGRHAAAARLLREVTSSLVRRQAYRQAIDTAIALGRLLLERGQVVPAGQAFDEAAQHAQSGGDEGKVIDARLWQATTRVDAARFTDAESIGRSVLLAGNASALQVAWAHAVVARVLTWQGRADEAAAAHVVPPQTTEGHGDAALAASLDATSARVLLATGHVFQAGHRARALVQATAAIADPVPRLVAATAHLRVLAAVGDLELAGDRLGEIRALARTARTPWRDVRAQLIWYDALRHAGREEDAQRVLTRMSRLGRAAPPLLKREIERRASTGAHIATPAPYGQRRDVSGPAPALAPSLLRLTHEEEDDEAALRRLLEHLARELQTVRLDLVSHDAGPATTLLSVGAGLPTRLAPRVLEAGIVIQEAVDGGREAGHPVRLGARLLGAIVGRWPVDRTPPTGVTDALEIAAAVAAPRLEIHLAARRESARSATSVPELIGVSAAMDEVRRAIARAARAPFAVLIEGESGVGKELAARAVHQLSPRRERRFCDVNCAALPDELLESELFGHTRGAFTGAVADKPGLFEEAHGGTLFLDEVADLSLRAQAKLLRVLQQHEVRRVGETFSRKVDVRVVTAANRDMRAEVSANRFRLDLLYRLDVIRIKIPPLRERPDDVAVLAEHFWQMASPRVGSAATLTHGVLSALASYHWPGNVRELQNVMSALAVAAPARGGVRASLLPAAISGSTRVTACRLDEARAEFERKCVEVALARAGGSRTRAAMALGLSRQGLLKTMARLGLAKAGGA